MPLRRLSPLPLLFLLSFPQGICFYARAATPASNLTGPTKLLYTGQTDEAITQLRTLVAQNPANAEAQLLLCRAFYAEQRPDDAVAACEAATSGALSKSSTAFFWLGRAYGEKASEGGPITGLRTAPKVRAAFETAVTLNPRDAASINALGEFYASAPGMVGGGGDKAHALADRSAATNPQAAHHIHAMAAESQRDYGTAEREFRAATAVANHADAWADLGDFYGRRKQYDQQLTTLQHAIALDKGSTPTTVDCAESLITAKRRPDLAEQWLRAYLAGSAQTDEQPTFKVHVLLGKILAKRGDKAAARAEYNKALAQAANFEPAQRALAAL